MKKTALITEKYILTAFFILAVLTFIYIASAYSQLYFHFFAIIFQTIISFCVFMLAWNSRRLVDNGYLSFLGTAFLFVGLFDLGHLIYLKNLNIITDTLDTHGVIFNNIPSAKVHPTNHAMQLGILARYIESCSFAVSLFFLRRKANIAFLSTLFTTLAVLLWAIVFKWHIFPVCFNEDMGFTPFYNASLLLITLTFLANALALYWQRRHLDKQMVQLLAAALLLAGLAEFAFSWNETLFEFSRVPAHLAKALSAYLIYKAFIKTGFTNPITLLFRDLKQSEITQARERDKLFTILDILPGFIYIQGQEYTISYANQRFKDIFGAVDDRRCHEIFHDCHSPCETCPAHRVLETKIPTSFEWTHKGGRTFIIHHGYFLDSDGTPKVLASGIDITDRVAARRALEESKERYRTLYEHTPVMLHSIDKQGRVINVSDHWLAMLGYEKEAVTNREFIDFLTPESRQFRMDTGLPDLLATGFCKNVHYQLIKKSGEVMDVALSAFAEKDATGDMQRSLAVSIDITEELKAKKELEEAREELELRVMKRTKQLKKQTIALEQEIRERSATEEALRASEKKHSLLVKNSLTGIYIKQNGKIIFANDRFCEIHGYTQDEIIGVDSWRLVHPYDRAMVEAYSRKRLEGASVPPGYEARGLTKSGKVIWVTRNNTRITYRDKPAILGNLMDITLRKKMEADLTNSEKELRLLSARLLDAQENERKRIALELHDTIAQNLVTIKFTLGQKLKQMGGGPAPPGIKIEDIINIVQQNISEVRRIMTDLRPSLLDDLGILATISWHCREFEKIYSHIKINQQIDLTENDVPEELKIVIFRILQEAMNNAAKHSGANRLDLSLCRQNGTIELMIRDNGEGFDFQNVLSRIDSSSGLGLVGMRERTEQSFGLFSIKSIKNKGTQVNARWRIGTSGVLVALKDTPEPPGPNSRFL